MQVVTWDNAKQFNRQIRKAQKAVQSGVKVKDIKTIGRTKLLIEFKN